MAQNDSDVMSEEGKSASDGGDEISGRVSAKQIVLNTYDLLGENVNRKEVWRALKEANVFDAGYEYFRRTYSEAADGKHDVEAAVNHQIQSVIEPVLWHAGLLSGEDIKKQSETSLKGDTVVPELQAGMNSSIDVENVLAVREKVELLREQAEFTESSEAEFVALKTLNWLDDLVKNGG